ncbi:Lamin tail domain-containing protein 1 [Microtus ochrogaster]|uniref:Lamin tail domain-containing protein 1 n=1 Tax=Microtus ochrogaster TaxID=79684 RepID=A0A8J6L1D5_MICOH|nr:Lamin tail domain-containing protein 1 [Microtus ochrogaster]
MQDTPKALTGDPDVSKHENKTQKEEIREEKFESMIAAKQPSSVHFFPMMIDLDNMQIWLSESLSNEMPVSFHQITSAQNSGLTGSSAGPLTSKSTIMSLSRGDTSLAKQSSSFMAPKKHLMSFDSATLVLGEGEDYFLSLFGDSRKLTAHSSQSEDVIKHMSVILEEVGQFTSSFLEDIKIADVNVKGLFVRLVNSSEDKEVEIGNHILQQNVNGHAVSLYRFPHNVTMQASSTVTVWAAAAEAKPEPPTDFVWEEQNRFRSSPDCTTILCKPNGEAIAWYTPIHWKQAWEKLETDIEFERCSVVIPTVKSHLFGWTVASASSINKEKQESAKREFSQYQIGHTYPALKREKEISPTVLPNRSPWCRSPYASPHPYCSLIESEDSDFSQSRLGAQQKPKPAKPESAPGKPNACISQERGRDEDSGERREQGDSLCSCAKY